ncbi:DUF3152 domain-containing protein, partial [Streptomyces sp. URMC 125]|uniref:DUF3152 domain-containing protein n=1 Tax=Streptomyces sp. URMC 125 TaxID=3423419 RepID=UPI003F1BC945
GPGVRGGHPEHREPGGAWGVPPQRLGTPGAADTAPAAPAAASGDAAHDTGRVPRQEYLRAFDDGIFGTPAASAPTGASGSARDGGSAPPAPSAPGGAGDGTAGGGSAEDGTDGGGTDGDRAGSADADGAGAAPRTGRAARRRQRGGRGRTVTGVAAAAVTAVLAVAVAGQVADGRDAVGSRIAAGGDGARVGVPDASRSDSRPTPSRPSGTAPSPAPSYDELMDRLYDLDPDHEGSGRLVAVPGGDEAPGSGERIRYRVDVEEGLPLDGELFAEAVHRTLNDERSWSHGGARTFERVSGDGEADFVITLAGPATTARWCARSGLDTTVDNVSCDSAATERVMINAYRWARGAETFGPERIREYREMLINHEVGHRLGRGHVGCPRDGALAPAMMQQTKYLTVGGATCRPNAWPFPDA